jgi:hypothetical protein
LVKDYLSKFKSLRDKNKLSGDEKNIDLWAKKSFEDFQKAVDREEHNRRMGKHYKGEALKWVHNFVNSNDNFSHQLDQESATVKVLAPYRSDGPKKVYRGLRFSSSQQATAFLKKYKVGSPYEHKSKFVSSWTESPASAERFARYEPADSHGLGMLKFFNRLEEKRSYDGHGGFIIEATLAPEKQVCEVAKVPAKGHRQHGNEGEIIALPGTIKAKITKIIK